jgi:hypothetical protein
VGVGLLVKQGYTFYVAGLEPAQQDGWTHFGSALQASDFVRVAGDGPLQPDWSPAGAPLEFGVFTTSSGSGSRAAFDCGIANFQVTLNGVTYQDDAFRDTDWTYLVLQSDDFGNARETQTATAKVVAG